MVVLSTTSFTKAAALWSWGIVLDSNGGPLRTLQGLGSSLWLGACSVIGVRMWVSAAAAGAAEELWASVAPLHQCVRFKLVTGQNHSFKVHRASGRQSHDSCYDCRPVLMTARNCDQGWHKGSGTAAVLNGVCPHGSTPNFPQQPSTVQSL